MAYLHAIRKGDIDLVISVGYGFWDPDLYEVFTKCLAQEAVLVRNERPRFLATESLSGRDVLRSSFFEDLEQRNKDLKRRNEKGKQPKLLLVESELLGTGEVNSGASLLVDLAKGLGTAQPGLTVPKKPDVLATQKKIGDVVASNVGDWHAVFWARLLDATNCLSMAVNPNNTTGQTTGTQEDLFLSEYHRNNSDLYVARNMVKAHLYSFPAADNDDNLARGSRACKELAALDKRPDIQVFVLGFWSFVDSLLGKKRKVFRAWLHLRCGKGMIALCDADTAMFFRHYERHFWLKCLEKFHQLSKGLYIPRGRAQHGLRPQPKMLAKKTRCCALAVRRLAREAEQELSEIAKGIKTGEKECGGHLVDRAEIFGDTAELCAEAYILSGYLRKAEKVVRRARLWRSFIGRPSNALQADRLLGWFYLAKDNPADRVRAISCFARGFARSLQLPHESKLAKKLGANLLRAIWAGDTARMNTYQGKLVDAEEVKKACGVLMSFTLPRGEHCRIPDVLLDNPDLMASVGTVTEYVLFLFGPYKRDIQAEVTRFGDLKRFPIYLPSHV